MEIPHKDRITSVCVCVWGESDFILAQSQLLNNILPNHSIPLLCIVMGLGFAEAGHSIHFLCIEFEMWQCEVM